MKGKPQASLKMSNGDCYVTLISGIQSFIIVIYHPLITTIQPEQATNHTTPFRMIECIPLVQMFVTPKLPSHFLCMKWRRRRFQSTEQPFKRLKIFISVNILHPRVTTQIRISTFLGHL